GLVGREHRVEGNSKLQVSASAAQTGGPGVAGVLIAAVSAPYAIVVDSASFIASAVFVLGIRRREQLTPPPAQERAGMRSELQEGLRHVFHNPLLRPIAICTATRNFFAAVAYAILLV